MLHEGHLIRRGVLFFVLYLTWTCYDYIFDLLQAGKPLDVNLAAVIAAILTPVSGLQGLAIKFYSDGRRQHNADQREQEKSGL